MRNQKREDIQVRMIELENWYQLCGWANGEIDRKLLRKENKEKRNGRRGKWQLSKSTETNQMDRIYCDSGLANVLVPTCAFYEFNVVMLWSRERFRTRFRFGRCQWAAIIIIIPLNTLPWPTCSSNAYKFKDILTKVSVTFSLSSLSQY